ncbi:MAG: lysophospholipid acyltransferase family protein [Desulfuromonadales bacterium]|nr:lysophospholipid acyltransferase family protein [Desulfuromonadales bacterium]
MARLVDRMLLSLAPLVAEGVIRGLYRLMRTEVIGTEHPLRLVSEKQPAIYATWHDQLLMMTKVYCGDKNVQILISASRDGELIARTMARFGRGTVRGSSNRGASEALRQMLRLARTDTSLAITPDGPKGPRHQLKSGVAVVACRSGRPVVPLAFVCSHGHRFHSWDRFLLPYPWARGVFSYGAPLYHSPGESIEDFMNRVQLAMEQNQRIAAARLDDYGLSTV